MKWTRLYRTHWDERFKARVEVPTGFRFTSDHGWTGTGPTRAAAKENARKKFEALGPRGYKF